MSCAYWRKLNQGLMNSSILVTSTWSDDDGWLLSFVCKVSEHSGRKLTYTCTFMRLSQIRNLKPFLELCGFFFFISIYVYVSKLGVASISIIKNANEPCFVKGRNFNDCLFTNQYSSGRHVIPPAHNSTIDTCLHTNSSYYRTESNNK